MKNPLSACRGQMIACTMGALIFILMLLPFCCHAQTFTNPSTLADESFRLAADTTYQIHGDTLFVTETWQGGFSVFVDGLESTREPKYFRRRAVYLLKFLKDQEPRTIEVQETITRPMEVWVDKKQ